MIRARSRYWNWLAWFLIGVSLFILLAPLSDGVGRIVSGVLAVSSFTFLGIGWWEDRRKRADRSGGAAISSNDQT